MRAYDHVRSILSRDGVVVLDGAMGTELEARGAAMDEDAWCGLVNLHDPVLVRTVHEDHIRARADVVITNTFMSGLGPMRRAGAGDEEFERGIRNAVDAAREAVARTADRPVVIAGSIGATPWGRPPVDPKLDVPEDVQRRAGYARQAQLLADLGAEVIALEMVTDATLGQAAVDAALALVRPLWPGTLGVYPHHGYWSPPHWTFANVPTDQLTRLADGWLAHGVRMIGGCCGLRTHHIAALRALADSQAQRSGKTR